ncbi:hypothetical protein LOK49_LG10G02434 [Camellia lanceoleosa]|uniref:Uncharacterized protein n=1 Tax=Camellia lanceoleosa TaxID=1840588 RepID=A0ACC0GCS5_9ERIC|nr:hypothetical protein LOK49_LG10G02434 [Camellia lanceoleosa]
MPNQMVPSQPVDKSRNSTPCTFNIIAAGSENGDGEGAGGVVRSREEGGGRHGDPLESRPEGPKVDRCIDVLSQLKNYPMTYDVLVSTQGSENRDGEGAGGVVRSGEEGGGRCGDRRSCVGRSEGGSMHRCRADSKLPGDV